MGLNDKHYCFIEADLIIGMDRKPKQFEQGVEFYMEILNNFHNNIMKARS
jgi:hypothetical protein